MDVMTIHGLSAGYRRHQALSDVDAAIPHGRVTALTGPNGSGKSTLLAVLAGVHPARRGGVERRHARRPALVPQVRSLPETFPITVRHVVSMGRWTDRGHWRRLRRADRELVAASLERLEITALAATRFDALSGGQRQRVLLAQCLVQASDVILLDEPETGLDADTRQILIGLLEQWRREELTVVQATHDAELAARADHRIRLVEGRVVDAAGA